MINDRHLAYLNRTPVVPGWCPPIVGFASSLNRNEKRRLKKQGRRPMFRSPYPVFLDKEHFCSADGWQFPDAKL
jgi:hypothetical protein